MNIGRYQSSAGRTRNKNSNELANYALGMVCEAGEVGDILKKHMFHGHELDMDELKKEIGDVMWYMANICNVLEIELDEIAIMNIEKLNKRYPNGFKVEDSVNREE